MFESWNPGRSNAARGPGRYTAKSSVEKWPSGSANPVVWYPWPAAFRYPCQLRRCYWRAARQVTAANTEHRPPSAPNRGDTTSQRMWAITVAVRSGSACITKNRRSFVADRENGANCSVGGRGCPRGSLLRRARQTAVLLAVMEQFPRIAQTGSGRAVQMEPGTRPTEIVLEKFSSLIF